MLVLPKFYMIHALVVIIGAFCYNLFFCYFLFDLFLFLFLL